MKTRKPIYALAVASIVSLLSGCSCGNNQTHVHNYVEHQKVDSTCTSLGNELYYGCSGCDLLFSDNKGTIIESIPVIEKKAHNYTKEDHDDKYLKEPATCSNKAKYYYSCVGCGEKGEESFEYGEYAEHPKEDTKWYKDEINHYHKTSCEHQIKYDENKHSFDNDGICETCEYHGKPIIHDTTDYETCIQKAGTIDLTSLIDDKTTFEETPIEGSDTTYTISKGGTYVLQGEFKQGIKIKKEIGSVQIYLNGASIDNPSGIAIDGGENTNVTITVVKDKTNTITNDYENKNAIHIKGNLVINGQGTLSVTSSTKTSIKCNSKLQIIGPTLSINAANHGISAESIEIQDTTIDAENCLKDGINAENEGEAFDLTKGYVSLKNVNYTCSVKGDGIQANSFVYIDGGTYNITTTGEYVEDNQENRTKYGLTDDDFIYNIVDGDVVVVKKGTHALTQSCKGIKVDTVNETAETKSRDYCLYVNSGNITIDSSDSALYSKYGNVILKNGTYDIKTNNVGLSSYFDAIVYSGSFEITSNEGIESSYILIKGGTFDFVVTDDGLNATERDEVKIPDIIVIDGDLTFTANNKHRGHIDAIDSNGRILIDGGNIKSNFVTSEFIEAYDNVWVENVSLLGFCNETSSFKRYIKGSSKHILFINGLEKKDSIVVKKDNEIIFEAVNSYGNSKLFLRSELLNGEVEVTINSQIFNVNLEDSYCELNVR